MDEMTFVYSLIEFDHVFVPDQMLHFDQGNPNSLIIDGAPLSSILFFFFL